MKKILSLALALIMLLSVMPMAYAAEKSLKDIYTDEVVRIFVYCYNVYDNQEFKDYIVDNYFTDVIGGNLGYSQWFADTEEEIPEKLEVLRAINAELEVKLADGEATVLVDTSAYVTAYIKYVLTGWLYGIDVESMAFYYFNNNDVDYDEINADYEKVQEIIDDNIAVTQEEFDALAEAPTYVHNLIVRHAFGEHEFVEYISNNDATEEADGTKTATCKICGATDTVVDEGSKLVKEPATFIDKIIEFFKSIFDRILSLFS